MNGLKLRTKRIAAGISGDVVCRAAANFDRSRYSRIENGHISGRPEEITRLNAAIDEIIESREKLRELAAGAGVSLAGVRL